jgi:hypothetical protein
MVQRTSEKISEMDALPLPSVTTIFPVTDGAASYRTTLGDIEGAILPNVDPRRYGSLVPNSSAVAAANTATLNAAIVAAAAASVALTGQTEVLVPAGKFWISGTIAMKSGVALRGAGLGRTTLYMPASAYTNTAYGTYAAASVAVSALGELSGGYAPLERVTLCDFTVESEVSDGRHLYPIIARNVHQMSVLRVEVTGLPAGTCIELDSVIGGEITGCWLHDCTSASANSVQLTGVATDNNRVNSVNSSKLDIHSNDIHDLTFSGAAMPAAPNMQTDGINLGVGTRHQHRIHDNRISNVGEGIDCFSSECVISGNLFADCANVGVKLIHGACNNVVSGNNVPRPGLAGLYVAGSGSASSDDNLLCDNLVSDVNPANLWGGSAAALRVDDAGAAAFQPNRNSFRDNKVTGGLVNMPRVIRCDSGIGNSFVDNESEGYATEYSATFSTDATVVNAKKTLVRASVGSTQATASGVEVTVDYDTEEVDSQGEFDSATNTFTANSNRRIRVTAQVRSPSVFLGLLKIRKNGANRTEAEPGIELQTVTVADTFTVVPGDTVSIRFVQSSGARDITANAAFSYLTIEEVAS